MGVIIFWAPGKEEYGTPYDDAVSRMGVEDDTRMANDVAKSMVNCEVRVCPYAGNKAIAIQRNYSYYCEELKRSIDALKRLGEMQMNATRPIESYPSTYR